MSPADGVADLDHLERLLAALHPAATQHLSADDLADRFDAERAALSAMPDPDELAVGAALSRVLAALGDAHVAVGLPMVQPGSVAPVSLLPILPRTVAGRVLVDATTSAWPVGTALLAIDDRPIAWVYATLSALVPADGREPEAVLRHLEADLPRWYALGYGMSAGYEVTVQFPGEAPHVERLVGADRTAARALRTRRHVRAWWGEPVVDPLPRLDRVAGLAVMRVPTLGVRDQEGFRLRVDALFADLDPEEPLVLDLRGDEGGLRTNANALLDHLLVSPYAEWTSMRVVARRVPARLGRDLAFPFGSLSDRVTPAFTGPRGPDGWTVPGDPLAATPPPGAHRGPVGLLVDARTGSAANGLALILEKERPETVRVGERLGGACDGHVGELPAVWTSPRTGIAVLFSVMHLTHVDVPGCEPGRGLAPEVRVEPTVDAFLAGVDPWLAALDW